MQVFFLVPVDFYPEDVECVIPAFVKDVEIALQVYFLVSVAFYPEDVGCVIPTFVKSRYRDCFVGIFLVPFIPKMWDVKCYIDGQKAEDQNIDVCQCPCNTFLSSLI